MTQLSRFYLLFISVHIPHFLRQPFKSGTTFQRCSSAGFVRVHSCLPSGLGPPFWILSAFQLCTFHAQRLPFNAGTTFRCCVAFRLSVHDSRPLVCLQVWDRLSRCCLPFFKSGAFLLPLSTLQV
jgi:hypothetical protein